jgi:hypothetical protein
MNRASCDRGEIDAFAFIAGKIGAGGVRTNQRTGYRIKPGRKGGIRFEMKLASPRMPIAKTMPIHVEFGIVDDPAQPKVKIGLCHVCAFPCLGTCIVSNHNLAVN